MICLFFFFPFHLSSCALVFFYWRGVSDGHLSICLSFHCLTQTASLFLFFFMSDACLAVYPNDSTVSPYLIVFLCVLSSHIYSYVQCICQYMFPSVWLSQRIICLYLSHHLSDSVPSVIYILSIKSLSCHLSFLNPPFAPTHLFFSSLNHTVSLLHPPYILFLFLPFSFLLALTGCSQKCHFCQFDLCVF